MAFCEGTLVLLLFLFLSERTHISAFNLDTENVIRKDGDRESLFGFSLAMHRQVKPVDKRMNILRNIQWALALCKLIHILGHTLKPGLLQWSEPARDKSMPGRCVFQLAGSKGAAMPAAFQSLSVQDKGSWVSVKERLLDTGQEILAVACL